MDNDNVVSVCYLVQVNGFFEPVIYLKRPNIDSRFEQVWPRPNVFVAKRNIQQWFPTLQRVQVNHTGERTISKAQGL